VFINLKSAKFSFGSRGYDGPDELDKVETVPLSLVSAVLADMKKMSAGMAVYFGFA
jgi:hypothetical protein